MINLQHFSKLMALVLAFFLLSGFKLFGPDYKALYKEEQQRTHFIKLQRDDYKARYEQEIKQRESWLEKINELQQENQELDNKNARLDEQNQQLSGGLKSLREALEEKQSQLEKRQEELDQERENLSEYKDTLRKDRNKFNEEIRKIGYKEGELEELRDNYNDLKKQEEKQQEDKTFWQRVAFGELIIFLIIFALIRFVEKIAASSMFAQREKSSPRQTVSIEAQESYDDQLSENSSAQKRLTSSNETSEENDMW